MKSTFDLRPPSVIPLHERVYHELRLALMSGKFEPGRRLTTRGVAAALGTSDMPVRSALARLASEGGFVQEANGTMTVPLVGRARFADVMQTRALLEGRAAGLASNHIDAAGLRRAHFHAEKLAEAVETRDIVEYLDENQRLKFAIYEHSGSDTLRALIELLWLQAGPFLRFLSNGLGGIMKINHHQDALEALEKGYGHAASAAISRDILDGTQHLLEVSEFADDPGTEAERREPTNGMASQRMQASGMGAGLALKSTREASR